MLSLGDWRVNALIDCPRASAYNSTAMTNPVNNPPGDVPFTEIAASLAHISRMFYDRRWTLGTSGNFSAVISRDPLRLAITSSGVDKGQLAAEHILLVDENGQPVDGTGQPSAETLLHVAIARTLGANAVFHTHSIWSTLVSEAHLNEGGLTIQGYEMLKGLEGVRSHEHCEWIPILDNSQDYRQLAGAVEALLQRHPNTHGLLLYRHGLYTWGADLAAAKRHVEILEFLLEVTGRTLPHVNGRPDQ